MRYVSNMIVKREKNLPNAPINMAIVLCSETEWNKNAASWV